VLRVDVDGEPTGVLTLRRAPIGWTAELRPIRSGYIGPPGPRIWRPWKFAAAAAALAGLCPLDRARVERT
jgi:hypothetical protein